MQAAARQEEDVVAVHDPSGTIHGQGTIRVTVEGDAHVAPVAADLSRQRVEVQRTAVEIDVAAVRRVADDRHLGSMVTEDLGGDLAGGAVGAVERQLEPLEPARGRDHVLEAFDISAGQARVRFGLPTPAIGIGEVVAQNQVLDAPLR